MSVVLPRSPRRVGMVTGIRPERIEDYKRLHADTWPGVLRQIRASRIRNFVIYLREPENLLFAHFDYVGDDLEADLAAMAADPETQEWWRHTAPCQSPLPGTASGETWAHLEEVFFAE